MKAKEIMTMNPCCCSVNDSVQDVARTMRDHDCGAVPVTDEGRLIGIVTDRDLTVRVLAAGLDSHEPTRTALASVSPFSDNPCQLLRWVNVALVEHIGKSTEFVTAECATYDPDAGLRSGGFMHLCVRVAGSLDNDVLPRVRAGGITPIEDTPMVRLGATGYGRSIYVRDPDGYVIELKEETAA